MREVLSPMVFLYKILGCQPHTRLGFVVIVFRYIRMKSVNFGGEAHTAAGAVELFISWNVKDSKTFDIHKSEKHG